MNCTKCKRLKHETSLVYSQDTLVLYCTECLEDGIPYTSMEGWLMNNLPEIYDLTRKSISTRLKVEQVVYLMKYARKKGTDTISQTFQAMVNDMMQRDNRDLDILVESPFVVGRGKRTPKEEAMPEFLKKRASHKDQIEIGTPRIGEIGSNNENDEDEDVFTI